MGRRGGVSREAMANAFLLYPRYVHIYWTRLVVI
jgi:hypothetical protein